MKNFIAGIAIAMLCTGCSGGSLTISPTTWLEIKMGSVDNLKYVSTKEDDGDKKESRRFLETNRLPDEEDGE